MSAPIWLRITWTDRRAAADDTTCTLESFIEANTPDGLCVDQLAQVIALQPGELVMLDWTTVYRLTDEESKPCLVCGGIFEGNTCCAENSKRLDSDTEARP